MHKWETKFEPGDKIKHTDGKAGIVDEVRILYPSGEDMDYWKETLPKIEDGKYQFTSYLVKFDDGEISDVAESALTLLSHQ